LSGQLNGHIAKDFVLMECNLRFLTIPASTEYSSIKTFSKWIGFNKRAPIKRIPEPLKKYAEMIVALRDLAVNVFPKETDWDYEYIVPLFIVAMGLLKYSEDCKCQLSARLHILNMADYVNNLFDSKDFI
jgi:hypothetical protein